MLGRRSLFPLLFLAFVFGLWQASSLLRERGGDGPRPLERSLFSPETIESLKELHVSHSEGEYTLTFGSEQGAALGGFRWRVMMPGQKALDGELLSQTLRLLFASQVHRVSTEDRGDLFGEQDGFLSLTLRYSDTNQNITFGSSNEYLGIRYVKLSGAPGVWSVPETLYLALRRRAADFYQKKLFSFPWEWVEKVTLISSRETVRFSRKDTHQWFVDGAAADVLFVEQYLKTLFSLPLKHLSPAQHVDAQDTLRSPQAQLVLGARNGKGQLFSQALFIGGEVAQPASSAAKSGTMSALADSPRLYYASLQGEEALFALSERSVKSILTRREVFLPVATR